MDEVKADREQLTAMANHLRGATPDLETTAASHPPMPEVSVSAGKVGYTLSAITKAVGGLSAQIEHTAAQIDTSDGSYGETDNTAAHDLYRSGSGLSHP